MSRQSLILICLLIGALGHALSLTAAERPLAPWPPPAGQAPVIIDTDAANEVDDQWAIALAIGFPERLRIEGFVAAHFGLKGGSKGIEKSYTSILSTLKAAGMSDKFVVKRGSDPEVYRDRVPESEGVDFIVEQARKATPEKPLWLVCLGPATDAAAAVMKDPSISDRLVIFWHGRTHWPEKAWNFNAYNDIKAVQIIFERPTRFILFDTGTYLTMPLAESQRRIAGLGLLGRFLHELRTPPEYATDTKGFFRCWRYRRARRPAHCTVGDDGRAVGRPRPALRFFAQEWQVRADLSHRARRDIRLA
jgi:hypothetical protein